MIFAKEIAPSAGERSIIVHEYESIDDAIVFESIPEAVELYYQYVKYVSEYNRKYMKSNPKKININTPRMISLSLPFWPKHNLMPITRKDIFSQWRGMMNKIPISKIEVILMQKRDLRKNCVAILTWLLIKPVIPRILSIARGRVAQFDPLTRGLKA